MDNPWTRHRYGKRHFALRMIVLRRRRRSLIRVFAAGAAVMAVLASLYE